MKAPRARTGWVCMAVLLLVRPLSLWCQTPVEIDALNARAWELIFEKPMEARQYSIQARDWSEKIGYRPGLGDCFSTLGYLYCSEGAYEDGYKYYEESLRVRRTDGDSAKVANVFINLSIFKNEEGRYDEARAHASRAIRILEGLLRGKRPGGDAYAEIAYPLGQAYLNLSNIYSDFQDNILALEYARKGFRAHNSTHNKLSIARASCTVANRFYTAWEPETGRNDYADSARIYYRGALEVFMHPAPDDAASISDHEIADIHYNLAQIDLDQGNYRGAWELLNQAETIFSRMEAGTERSTGLFYVGLSKGKWFAEYKGDCRAALDLLRRADAAVNREAVDVNTQLELFNAYSQTFARCGRRDSAYHYQKLAADLGQTYFIDRQTRFQTGERSDWQQKLNSEIAESALVKARQRYLIAAVLALLLLAVLIAVVAWGIVRALQRRTAAANQKIQEMVANLDAKYLEGIESEREAIAGILHDDLGGQSVATTWMIEALIEQLPPDAGQHDLAGRILHGSRQLSESIRAFSHRLSSIYVQRSGLVPALEELCHNISRGSRLQARLTVQPWEEKLDIGREIQLLRILQELITNTVKYARAREIDIHLGAAGPEFQLRYADDGIGFDIRSAMESGKGLGMENITRRAAVLQAKLEAGSNPGAGMWVTITFPLSSVPTP